MPKVAMERPVATPRIVELRGRATAVVDVDAPASELPAALGEAFRLTADAIMASGAAFGGEPFARYLAMGERIRAEVGFPFVGALRPTGRVRESALPGGQAVMTTHVGSYDELGRAWERGALWAREHGLAFAGPGWECYLSDPNEPGPPVTEIYWPVG
jgi:effector-binding domain-containing protein